MEPAGGGDAVEPAYAVANDLPPPAAADAPAPPPGDGFPPGYGGGRGRGRGRGRGGGDGWPRGGHRGGRGGGGRDPWRPRPPPGQVWGPPGAGAGFGLPPPPPPPPGAADPYATLPVAFGRAPRGPPQAKAGAPRGVEVLGSVEGADTQQAGLSSCLASQRPRHGGESRGRGGGGRGGAAAGAGALAQGHIGQFVKPSFLDNPWAELERQLGLPPAMQRCVRARAW